MSDLQEALEWWDQNKGFLWQRLSDEYYRPIFSAFKAAKRQAELEGFAAPREEGDE